MRLQHEVRYIPIVNIRPNPYQPRKDFSRRSLEELSQSIKSYGVIQPISVRQIKGDKFELIAGERRLRASELAELAEIPAIVVEYKDRDSAVIALIENLQREDLNFMEEAEGYFNVINDHNYTQQDLAERIGKSQSTIANKIRLLKLPTEIQRALVREDLTERHGRALLKLHDDNVKVQVLEEIVNRDLNVSETEEIVESILDKYKSKDIGVESKLKIKSAVNLRIYLNTIRKAYKLIKDSGVNIEYKETDAGDHVQVLIKIFKEKQ